MTPTLEYQIEKIIKKHTHECHSVIVFDDARAILELTALVREREKAAYDKGYDEALEGVLRAEKEQPK